MIYAGTVGPWRSRSYQPREVLRLTAAHARADAHWAFYPTQRRRLSSRFEAAAQRTGHHGHGPWLARRHLEVGALSDVLLRHTDMWPTIRYPADVAGPIIDSGHGIVLTSIHSPTMWISAATASSVLGYEIMWAVGDQLLGADPEHPADEGAAVLAATGSTLIRVHQAYRDMHRHLIDHGIVGVLLDVPGPVEVKLLGKRTLIHPWFARLARRTGSAILPCLGCWEGGHLTLKCGQPHIPQPNESLSSTCQQAASSMEALWETFPHHWSPYTNQLWPHDVGPYLWAFDGH